MRNKSLEIEWTVAGRIFLSGSLSYEIEIREEYTGDYSAVLWKPDSSGRKMIEPLGRFPSLNEAMRAASSAAYKKSLDKRKIKKLPTLFIGDVAVTPAEFADGEFVDMMDAKKGDPVLIFGEPGIVVKSKEDLDEKRLTVQIEGIVKRRSVNESI